MSLTNTPATTETPTPELTDELAKVLTTVLTGIDDSPERKRDERAAALSVLQQLGYVFVNLDGEWIISVAGREALAARQAAKEAAAREALVASYAAVVAELHAMADAIDAVPVDGLAELTVDLRIGTKLYGKNEEADAVNVATVDAVAKALLGNAGTTAQLGYGETWQHKAEGARGPADAIGRRGAFKVEVATFISDPTARERERAEQARESEMERLRAELAEARRQLVTGAELADGRWVECTHGADCLVHPDVNAVHNFDGCPS